MLSITGGVLSVLCGVLADDEGAAGGLDDVAGDDVQAVDLHDAGDLGCDLQRFLA